jgi:hypothetical protein
LAAGFSLPSGKKRYEINSLLVMNVTSSAKAVSLQTSWQDVEIKDYYAFSGSLDTKLIGSDGMVSLTIPSYTARIYINIADVNEGELP